MANSHPRGEPHHHQRLAERFDQRAARLRKQAEILLVIIIAVLVVGALAFVFANDITRFTLHPRTAEDQYATVEAAENKNRDQLNLLAKQIKEIMDTAIPASFDENLSKAVSGYTTFESDVLTSCNNILQNNTAPRGNLNKIDAEYRPSLSWGTIVNPSNRIGEYTLLAPFGVNILFANKKSADECEWLFVQSKDDATRYLRVIQDRLSERDAAEREMLKSKEPTLKPLQENSAKLLMENRRLDVLRDQLQDRVIQEKVLGGQVRPEGETTSDKAETKIDWARVIETNATRIGALVTMFFLVSILVPQYRST